MTAMLASNLMHGTLSRTKPISVSFAIEECEGKTASLPNEIEFATDVPSEFMQALADFKEGRIVSMDTALNENPPGA